MRTVEVRLRANRLRPLHRGVYLAGPLLPRLEREMAAVLACLAQALARAGLRTRWWHGGGFETHAGPSEGLPYGRKGGP
jgi:hypothetical protein